MTNSVASQIREVRYDDLSMLREWRNNKKVRQFMYTNHEISEKEHLNWYNRIIADQHTKIFIYEENGEPMGFLNFSKVRTEHVVNWGFYLNPEAPKGTGRRFGNAALTFGFHKLKLHKICGEALAFNERSIKFHLSLGFMEEGRMREQHFDGVNYHDVICFGLLESDLNNVVNYR